jgi:hypothetical protein
VTTIISDEIIVSVARTESNKSQAWGSVMWPTRERPQRLGFQSHRNELISRAREKNNEGDSFPEICTQKISIE